MLSIRNNIGSLTAQKNLFSTQIALDNSISKLSSGYRISKASDDPAANAIATHMNAEVLSYAQATRNAQDGLGLISAAEGAMGEIASMITRMREIAMQAASNGVSNTERTSMQGEVAQLIVEIDRLNTAATEYNGYAVFDNGNGATDATFQVGIRNTAANDRFTVTSQDADATALGINAATVATVTDAQAALTTIDTALQSISTFRATNATQGARLDHIIASLQATTVAVTASYSRVKDVDVAEESARLTRAQIMMQAGVSVLAQANQIPLATLKLLG
jgi:flagellin